MHEPRQKLWIKIGASAGLVFTVIWLSAIVVLDRNYSDAIKAAGDRVRGKSQLFAQYTRSTVLRIDQMAREVGSNYERNPSGFQNFVSRQAELVQDIVFQTAILDRNGTLLASSLDANVKPIDLSDREHFQVHKVSPESDKLFISRPLVGKVSRQWTIQFSRPIFKNGKFDGVVVVSVDPAQFGSFGRDMELASAGVASIARYTGERMAR